MSYKVAAVAVARRAILQACKRDGLLYKEEVIHMNLKDIFIYLIDINIIDRHELNNSGSGADSTFAYFEYCTYGGTNFKR